MSTGACCSARDELTSIRDARDAFRLRAPPRRRREFTPDEQKDSNYWLKRRRNNEAAKRSRQRKRMEERLLETRAVALQRENDTLKAALCAVQLHRSGSSPADPGLRFPLAPAALLPCCALPHTSHLAFGLTAYSASKSPRVGLLDGCYPMGFAHGPSAFTRSASADSPEMLPDCRSVPGARALPKASCASPAVLLPHKLRYKAASFASPAGQTIMMRAPHDVDML